MRSSIIESVDFICRESTDTLYNTSIISSLSVFLTNKTTSSAKKHRKRTEPKDARWTFLYLHFFLRLESLTTIFAAFYTE